MNNQASPEQQAYIDRIYKREMEFIKQGQNAEVAHAVAVAEDTLRIMKEEERSSL